MTIPSVELLHLFRRALAGLAVIVLIILGIVTMIHDERATGVVLLASAISVALTLREESQLYKQLLHAGHSFDALTNHLKSL